MSSDLRDLIRTDLDRIPLPPATEWIQLRARRRLRALDTAAITLVVIVVVVASLGVGQALRAVRDWVETQRVATGLVAGNDYIYLADGDPSSQYVQVVAMPGGQSSGRFVGQTYVGSVQEGGLVSVSGDVAYLPVASSGGLPPDTYNTYLERIDLRRGVPIGRLGLGFVTAPRLEPTELPGTPAFAAATATSSDGKTLWLVRDTGEHGLIANVDRFDAQVASTTPVAHATITSAGDGATRSRIVALGPDRVAVIRERYPVTYQGARLGVDWYILDDQLQTIATYPFEAHRMPAGGFCSPDVRRDPTADGWILLCSDPFLFQDGAVVFLSRDGLIVAQTPLSRELGYALGMTVTPDRTVNVLTSRPVVARVDARTHGLIDARPVTELRSLLDRLLPPAAAAKGPGGRSVVFSFDGRYAYLIADPLVKIDLSTAKVVTRASGIAPVGGLALSEDGERLYALVIDGQTRTIALLDPRSLRLAAQTAPLANDPYGIVVVRTPLPLGP